MAALPTKLHLPLIFALAGGLSLGCSGATGIVGGASSRGASSGKAAAAGSTATSAGVKGSSSGRSTAATTTTSGATGTSGTSGCGLQTCLSVGASCGPIGDGCGGVLQCGDCTAPETCGGGGTPSVCGGQDGCVPTTCAAAGVECGPLADGCGKLLQCGGCTAPESCGGGGQDGICGTSNVADGGLIGPDGGCQPLSCGDLGIDCGPAGDGCGGVLHCGTCTSPKVCGGAGTPSVCSKPISSCKPKTCKEQSYSCGQASDGCGNLLQCGSCIFPETCGGGGSANACGNLAADAGLTITPPSPTLTILAGTPATVQLTAKLNQGGTSKTVNANWNSSRPDLASIDQTGLVTAPGPEGGQVTITAGYLGLAATTAITLLVDQQVCSPDCNTAPPSAFANPPTASASNSPTFLYPYNLTVIPVNLLPMEFQWEPGAGNNLYQLTVKGSAATLVATVVPANPAQPSYTFPAEVWQPFAHSNVGQTLSVSLEATNTAAPGTVYAAPAQSLTLASSRMAGSIYYWAVSLGEIRNIPAGASSSTQVYTPPAQGGVPGGSTCIACHSVSPDGTKMAAELWGGGAPGTVVQLLEDGGATPIVSPPGNVVNFDFSTFDPTGDLLVVSNSGDLTLRSSATGAPVPGGSSEGNLTSLSCGTGAHCTQPVWSRDGNLLLFVRGLASGYGADWSFSASDLMISNYTSASQSFSAPTTLVTNNYDGSVLANVYPTISVDDSLVAFTRSLCAYADSDPCAHSSSLAILPSSGGSPLTPTGALTLGDGSIDDSARFPNFSPFKEGGYHWMAFFSMRPYGWVTANKRQIWVTAIDDNPNPTTDPSHPGFWLPGQDPTSDNDKAEWASLPCVGEGQSCQGDLDCCGEPSALVCTYAAGGSTCQPPAPQCSFWGASCATSADCCTPSTCQQGSCCNPLTCAQLGLDCGPAGDGCGGVIQCGSCTAPESCGGAGVSGVCGTTACKPQSCADLGFDCGPAGDGCGGQLDCGQCTAPATCGGTGIPSVCGAGTQCTPQSCADQNLSCGPAGDGCGNTLHCGDCPSGQSCGGGGTPGACGSPDCTPQTCEGLGYTCGAAADGCGGTLECGGCDGGSCGGSGKPNQCGSLGLK